MTTRKFDVAVIGSGPGGYVAAIRAAQLGFNTVCIEKSKPLGGTCLNVGCIPSKALLQSTELLDTMKNSSKIHGIQCADAAINFPELMQRKTQIVKGLTDGVAWQFKRTKVERIEGTARFISDHTVEVVNGNEKEQVEAKYFILATGSEPIQLPFLPFDEKRIVSSTGVLSLAEIPKKMTVIGAGVIGVELASVYARLGTEVTILEMLDYICPGMDAAISKQLLQILKKQGLSFQLGAQVISANQNGSTVNVKYKVGDQESEIAADVVLVGVGRRPYTQGLDLDKIGVKTSSKGVVEVNSRFQTSVPHIYAIGDIIDGPMLAHKASEEGVAAAEIIAGLHPHINYMAIPNVIYTHPEAVGIGFTEKEAKEKGLEIKVGTSYFKANGRARCLGYTEGFVKIIGEAKSGRVIGLHLIGPHVSEMAGEGVIAIDKRATLEDIANASHAHPTLTESVKEAALMALGRPIHA